MVNFSQLAKKLDQGNIASSIESLPYQCQQAWNEAKRIKLPSSYFRVKEIVVCGMGGSALGTDFLRYNLYDELKLPVNIINDYQIPAYVSRDSLVIISSYSGNTQESLSCFKKAIKKKSKIIIITAGGKLAQIAKRNNIPAYIFEPRFNPSNQPRMGLGYSIMAQLAIFNQLGFLRIKEREIKKAFTNLIAKEDMRKKAKILACKIKDKIPLIVAAEFLSGNAHILANQINENAKNFAAYFLLPELNHHLMEGLKYPQANKNLVFLFLESNSYTKILKKRIFITKKVLKKNKIFYLSYITSCKGKLVEGLEVLIFGSWLSFYLALLNNVNPSLIPFVDYFKKELEKK